MSPEMEDEVFRYHTAAGCLLPPQRSQTFFTISTFIQKTDESKMQHNKQILLLFYVPSIIVVACDRLGTSNRKLRFTPSCVSSLR